MIVEVKLRFITPCLGNVREEGCDRMIKDQEGNVVFMQSWWRGCLRYGAKALNRLYKEVDQVQASPIVTGALSLFKRYYSSDKFTYHESFAAGDVITVSFCLPDKVNPNAFKELLEVGGKYVGISPYGYRADYGRFAVVSVKPGRHHKVREPDPGNARDSGPPGPSPDVQEKISGIRGSPGRSL